jgi:hypothetical protein
LYAAKIHIGHWLKSNRMHPAYTAARAAAVRIHPHYAARHDSEELLPKAETIEALIDVAFWASLRREESYTPRISLAFVAQSRIEMPLLFERPVPLGADALTHLGPAVERPGIHLCVYPDDGDLQVWGATRNLPEACFVLEVVAPGLLVVKRSPTGDSGKYVNVAVLQGDELKVIDQHFTAAPDSPDLISNLLGVNPEELPSGHVDVLTQLAVSMRGHGRGGSLLVVPAGDDSWRESILQPVGYSVSPPFGAIGTMLRENPGERQRRRWQEEFRRLIEGIAGLTAVDGATIVTDHYEVLAFGAKIVRRPKYSRVGTVIMSEPVEGASAVVADAGQIGGTRHLSGAQFAHDQRDAVALVASQDGRFTVFGWSPQEEMVRASRIEALLL